jgi:hypothetical protein
VQQQLLPQQIKQGKNCSTAENSTTGIPASSAKIAINADKMLSGVHF